MSTAYDAYMKASQELEKVIEDNGARIVVEALAPFFEKNEKLEGIRWKQYAPHFNDGDPCVFHVRECLLDWGDGFTDEYEFDSGASERGVYCDVDDCLSSIENLLEQVYGSGQEITVTRDRNVATDDCYHD